MIVTTAFADKRVIVLGLGKSGLSAAQVLRLGGAHVALWDDQETSRAKTAAKPLFKDFPFVNPQTVNWRDYDALILAPGIPFTHPEPHPAVRKAQDQGRQVIGDVELFALANLAAKTIGITGTNGKSTTTALVGHILAHAKRPSAVGGNIGTPLLDLAPLGPQGIYTLELSSFQLDLAPSLSVDVGVLLNLSVDHLDRHGSMEHYASVKAKMLHQQSPTAYSVVSLDDPFTAKIAQELFLQGRRVIGISTERPVPDGVYVQEGQLTESIHGVPHKVLDLKTLDRMPGAHNWQNIAAAYAAVRAAGLSTSEASEAIVSFPGLAHRQELVGEMGHVRFVNDSKATNVEAAIKALGSYGKIYWIVGGRPKAGNLAGIESFLGTVDAAYTIGEATERFADALEGRVPNVETCGTMSVAINRAFQAAQMAATKESPATVLLSPAAASFDQFKSFEDRGNAYRSLVRILCGHNVSDEDTVFPEEVVA